MPQFLLLWLWQAYSRYPKPPLTYIILVLLSPVLPIATTISSFCKLGKTWPHTKQNRSPLEQTTTKSTLKQWIHSSRNHCLRTWDKVKGQEKKINRVLVKPLSLVKQVICLMILSPNFKHHYYLQEPSITRTPNDICLIKIIFFTTFNLIMISPLLGHSFNIESQQLLSFSFPMHSNKWRISSSSCV